MVNNDKNRIKAAVIGAGHMGEYHIRVYAELWDVDLVGIVDVNEEKAKKLATQYGTEAYMDYKNLFGRIDVVSLAVPTPLHYPIAKDLLKAGVHLLVEKPLTSDLKQAKELFRIANKKNVIMHVGQLERFNGAVQELKKIVKDPILIESRRLGPFVPRVKDDGVVMDLMIHDIDIILNIIDSKIIHINAMGKSIISNKEDVANVQILFSNGCIANITASRATEEKIRTLSITQKDAYIFLDYTSQDIHIHRRSMAEYMMSKEAIRYKQESFIERIFVHKDNPLKLEIQHLISAVRKAKRTGKVIMEDGEDVRSLALALEITKKIQKYL